VVEGSTAHRDPLYEAMARFWTRIFAVNFAMGVATGIVMGVRVRHQLATYSRFVGDVFARRSPPRDLRLLPRVRLPRRARVRLDRVSPRMHFFSTVMVALGSTFSAVWNRRRQLVAADAGRLPHRRRGSDGGAPRSPTSGDGVQPLERRPARPRPPRRLHPRRLLRHEHHAYYYCAAATSSSPDAAS